MTDKAQLEWRDAHVPYSPQFDDTYFSKAGGREETDYVFIKGNDLPARWRGAQDVVVAELGFGSGLNFFETLRQVRLIERTSRPHLIFQSFERYPMTWDAMARTLSPWPDLTALLDELSVQGEFQAGWQRRDVPDATLYLGVGDAAALVSSLPTPAQAWYLDGFNPAKNPELWGQPLMQAVHDHTVPGGTFATYTAAGWVRRNLQAAGFEVERCKGFGNKREMMKGRKL